MKTINQFDYPTAAASSFKAYKEQLKEEPKQKQIHYQKINKQESQQQRNRVKFKQEQKKKASFVQQQKKLKEEIERKKKEVKDLEVKMQEALQYQRKAAEMAKLKEEHDRIKKFQEIEKYKENQQNAQFRFRDALRRLEVQKSENAVQERQAQQRRKANLDAEKVERAQATKYQQWQKIKNEEQAQRQRQEENKKFEMMRKGLGRHGLNKPLDYSKTCFHNPHMVFRTQEEGPNAFQRGQSQQKQRQEQKINKKQREKEERLRSLERGSIAMQKIQREQEYRSYQKQTQQQQKSYNLQRIEQGKKNQFIGVKPLTLAQIQSNKKLRGQQQFQNMFLGPQVTVYQQPASKYLIIEKKYHQEGDTSGQLTSHIDNSYMNTHNASRKYNYEEEDEDMEPRQGVEVEPTRFKPMGQTRAQQAKPHKQELYYSQSEEDSQYP